MGAVLAVLGGESRDAEASCSARISLQTAAVTSTPSGFVVAWQGGESIGQGTVASLDLAGRVVSSTPGSSTFFGRLYDSRARSQRVSHDGLGRMARVDGNGDGEGRLVTAVGASPFVETVIEPSVTSAGVHDDGVGWLVHTRHITDALVSVDANGAVLKRT